MTTSTPYTIVRLGCAKALTQGGGDQGAEIATFERLVG